MRYAMWLFAVAVSAGLSAGEVQAGERVFHVLAVEPKGTAQVAKESFPAAKLPAGGGYVLKAPDVKGNWQVSAYVFQPAQIFVRKGDDVTIHFVGINGAGHTITVEGYQAQAVKLRRGAVQTVKFKADKAGAFRIGCREHQPSMNGELIVLD